MSENSIPPHDRPPLADLRERAEEIADFAVGERHNADMYQRVADMALEHLRDAVEAERLETYVEAERLETYTTHPETGGSVSWRELYQEERSKANHYRAAVEAERAEVERLRALLLRADSANDSMASFSINVDRVIRDEVAAIRRRT